MSIAAIDFISSRLARRTSIICRKTFLNSPSDSLIALLCHHSWYSWFAPISCCLKTPSEWTAEGTLQFQENLLKHHFFFQTYNVFWEGVLGGGLGSDTKKRGTPTPVPNRKRRHLPLFSDQLHKLLFYHGHLAKRSHRKRLSRAANITWSPPH